MSTNRNIFHLSFISINLLLVLLACDDKLPKEVNARGFADANCEKAGDSPFSDKSTLGLKEDPFGSSTSVSVNDCLDDNSDVDPFANQGNDDDLVPNFDTANLDPRFNRSKFRKLKIPEEYETIRIIAKKVPYYRGIWLDLRKEVWSGFNFDNDVFTAPDQYDTISVSVHQPLQSPSILDFDDEPLSFYLSGHRAHSKFKAPTTGTLIFTPSPYIENNIDAIAPPKDYELIYEVEGLYTEDVLIECQNMQKDLAEGKTITPAPEIQRKCDTITPGSLIGSYNSTTGTYNSAFDEFYKKQSAAIWKPIPQEGYKCLGHVATNGRLDKPFSERDFAQSVVEFGFNERFAMYCVKEEYVLPGKISDVALVSDGDLHVYMVESLDGNKDSEGNLFYAHKGSKPKQDDVEVWVLNTEFVKIIGQDELTKDDLEDLKTAE